MTAGVSAPGGSRAVEHLAPSQHRHFAKKSEEKFGDLLEVSRHEMPDEAGRDVEEATDDVIPAGVPEGNQTLPPSVLLLSMVTLERISPNVEATSPAADTDQSLTQLLAAGGMLALPAQAAATAPETSAGTMAPGSEDYTGPPGDSPTQVLLEVTGHPAAPGDEESRVEAKPEPRDEASASPDREGGKSDVGPLTGADGKATDLPDVTPALQIISKIGDLAARPAGTSPEVSSPQNVRMSDNDELPRSELKALRIRLQPEDLGDVEITLRRIGQETQVLIAVTTKAAAEQLRRDLSLLEDRLGSLLSPGSVQTVSISLQPQDTGLMPEQASPEPGPFTHDDAGPPGGQTSGSDGRASSDRQRGPTPLARNERHEEDRPAGTPAPGSRIV